MRHTYFQWMGAALLTAVMAFLSLSAALAGPSGPAGPYRVEITTEPAVIPVGKVRLNLNVTAASGKPVAGAQVRALVQMPAMPMGEQEQAAMPQPGRPGVYTAPAALAMEGEYNATIRINGPQGSGRAIIPL